MDKIWYRNPSEVIDRCGGDEKTEWPRRTDKSRTLKNNLTMWYLILVHVCVFLKVRENEFQTFSNDPISETVKNNFFTW